MVVILVFSITWRVDVSSFCDVTIGRSICGERRRHAGPCAHGVTSCDRRHHIRRCQVCTWGFHVLWKRAIGYNYRSCTLPTLLIAKKAPSHVCRNISIPLWLLPGCPMVSKWCMAKTRTLAIGRCTYNIPPTPHNFWTAWTPHPHPIIPSESNRGVPESSKSDHFDSYKYRFGLKKRMYDVFGELRQLQNPSFGLLHSACSLHFRKRISRKGNPSEPPHSLEVDLGKVEKVFIVMSLFLIGSITSITSCNLMASSSYPSKFGVLISIFCHSHDGPRPDISFILMALPQSRSGVYHRVIIKWTHSESIFNTTQQLTKVWPYISGIKSRGLRCANCIMPISSCRSYRAGIAQKWLTFVGREVTKNVSRFWATRVQ